MYKKLVLAASIAATSTAAVGATWDVNGVTMPIHTDEGIVSLADTAGANLGNAKVRLGAEYAQNDLITFTLNMDKATNSNWPTSFECIRSAGAQGGDAHAQGGSVTTVVLDNNTNATASIGATVLNDQFTLGTATSPVYVVTGIATNTITYAPATSAVIADTTAIKFLDVKDLTFGLVSSTNSSATYRLSAAASGTTTIGSLCPVPTMAVKASGLIAGDASVSFSATTGAGTAMDTATLAALKLGSSIPQFTQTLNTKFDAVIDVEVDSKKYDGTLDVDTDIFKITQTESTGTADGTIGTVSASGAITFAQPSSHDKVVAGTTSSVYTVVGDFSFLDEDLTTALVQTSEGTSATADEIDDAGSTACVASIPTTGASLLLTASAAANVCTVQVNGSVPAVVIPKQSFTYSTTHTYTPSTGTATTATTASASAGAWTLNGASITAFGVPMGSAVSRFIWVNNKGATDAAFTYTATMNGSSYGPYSVATVAAKTAGSLGGLIDTDMAARGIYVAPSSRANITLTAPVKAADITVSASYKHIGDADRLALETSDTDRTAK
jgi:hypothetical protein